MVWDIYKGKKWSLYKNCINNWFVVSNVYFSWKFDLIHSRTVFQIVRQFDHLTENWLMLIVYLQLNHGKNKHTYQYSIIYDENEIRNLGNLKSYFYSTNNFMIFCVTLPDIIFIARNQIIWEKKILFYKKKNIFIQRDTFKLMIAMNKDIYSICLAVK